jgi:hypothetical protein|tara:strand:+ start:3263 stop:3445 length:183 start_codon:yes stop_codon:yes gene_type:complete
MKTSTTLASILLLSSFLSSGVSGVVLDNSIANDRVNEIESDVHGEGCCCMDCSPLLEDIH